MAHSPSLTQTQTLGKNNISAKNTSQKLHLETLVNDTLRLDAAETRRKGEASERGLNFCSHLVGFWKRNGFIYLKNPTYPVFFFFFLKLY